MAKSASYGRAPMGAYLGDYGNYTTNRSIDCATCTPGKCSTRALVTPRACARGKVIGRVVVVVVVVSIKFAISRDIGV